MPGRCGTICSRESDRSAAIAPSAVTMLIVISRLAITFTIAEVKPACGRWSLPCLRPDIGPSGLWFNAFLNPRKQFLIVWPGGLLQLTLTRRVGDCTCLSVYGPARRGATTH